MTAHRLEGAFDASVWVVEIQIAVRVEGWIGMNFSAMKSRERAATRAEIKPS
jgi:hypothetical protein